MSEERNRLTCERQARCTKDECLMDCEDWKDSHVDVRKETKSIEVALSDEELVAIADELCDADDELTVMEDKLKSAKEKYGAKVKVIQKTIENCVDRLKKKTEQRNVLTDTILDYKEQTVTVMTAEGEVIEAERPMTEDEVQRHMESVIPEVADEPTGDEPEDGLKDPEVED